MASIHTNQDHGGLLALPAELRNRIWSAIVLTDELISPARYYSYAYNDDEPVHLIEHLATRSFRPRPSLLAVSRLIREEALPMYYGSNSFDFGCFIDSDVEHFRRWWNSLSSGARHVRRLRFVCLKTGSCGFHSFGTSGSFVIAHHLVFNEPGTPRQIECDTAVRDYCGTDATLDCNRSGKRRALWDASQLKYEVESWMPTTWSQTRDEQVIRNVGKTIGDFLDDYDHYLFVRVKTHEWDKTPVDGAGRSRSISFSNPPSWAAGEQDFFVFPQLATIDPLSCNFISDVMLDAMMGGRRRVITRRGIDQEGTNKSVSSALM